jgi:phosphoheptose isomerase
LEDIVLDTTDRLRKNLKASKEVKQRLMNDENCLKDYQEAVNTFGERYQKGGQLYIAGNGGSAANAQHLAAEFVSNLAQDRAALSAEALTVDSTILTAIGNDYGFDSVLSRQISWKGNRKRHIFRYHNLCSASEYIKGIRAVPKNRYSIDCFLCQRWRPCQALSRLFYHRAVCCYQYDSRVTFRFSTHFVRKCRGRTIYLTNFENQRTFR